MNYPIKLLVLLFLFSNSVFAEDLKRCGSSEANIKLLEENPENLRYKEQLDSLVKAYFENQTEHSNTQKRSEPTLVIPIVFHVIHNYGAENISDEQIYNAVEIINTDFRRRNSDTSDVIPEFKSIVADANIEFRLATKDPDGNCTNGIDRIQSIKTNFANDESKLNPWPRDYYLNIWVTRTIGVDGNVAGYAYKPPSAAGLRGLVDGIIVLYDYVGGIGTSNYTRSRTLTHEIGHYLNLDHTWGGTNEPGVACGDDGVLDTPITAGWTTCNLNGANCNAGIKENVQNYMEYSYCSRMFTEGQKAVMRIALDNPIASRRNLWQEATHLATGVDPNSPSVNTCPPIADFNSTIRMACVGDQVNFTDFSWRGDIDTYEWTFSNATPATSSDVNPSVVFNTPGWQTVTLKVENALGKSEKTLEKYIYITDEQKILSQAFMDGFEDDAAFEEDWIVLNHNNNATKWQKTNLSYYSGISSVYINNIDATQSDMDELISPSYDIANSGVSEIKFNYSYATQAASASEVSDTLSLFYSINCGQTWTRFHRSSGVDLLSSGNFPNSYVPNLKSMWRELAVPFPANVLSSNNVKFKIRFSNQSKANNFYIDNLNIREDYSYTSINSLDAANIQLNVFPIPNTGTFKVQLDLEKETLVQIELIDLAGKKMYASQEKLSAGSNIIPVEANVSSGIYILSATVGDRKVTRKITVLK